MLDRVEDQQRRDLERDEQRWRQHVGVGVRRGRPDNADLRSLTSRDKAAGETGITPAPLTTAATASFPIRSLYATDFVATLYLGTRCLI
jgi:hypothetical protein